MFQLYPDDAVPVFVGHYFKSADSPLRPERHNEGKPDSILIITWPADDHQGLLAMSPCTKPTPNNILRET